MRSGGYILGGESSGHLIFLDHSTTGDGILAALQILSIMKRRGKAPFALETLIVPVPQIVENVPVLRREEFSAFPALQKKLKQSESRLNGRGRLLLRYSGTEPLVRIMVEGEDEIIVKEIVEDLKGEVIKFLGGA